MSVFMEDCVSGPEFIQHMPVMGLILLKNSFLLSPLFWFPHFCKIIKLAKQYMLLDWKVRSSGSVHTL